MRKCSDDKADQYSAEQGEFFQKMRRYDAIIVILVVANFVIWISGIVILATGV